MQLDPYAAVNGVPFSVTRDEVLRIKGRPVRQARNDVGLDELDYDDIVFRFQDSGRLEEVTARVPVLTLGTVAVPFGALESFIRDNDLSSFDRAGFLVSPMFGLAFDPQCPSWVTALAAHCIAEWRPL